MSRCEEQIGRSVEGRPLVVRHHGTDSAKVRVFLIAGQHGDEPLARDAVEQFVATPCASDIDLAALMNANPDGAKRNQRRNAGGIDLNRDHQCLNAPETQAIQTFARRWRPHLIIDVHTYPPRRKHLLARNLVHANDVFMDIANNPTACEGTRWSPWSRKTLPAWLRDVRAAGFRCDRYTIITRGGRVRHSTPDVVDARNGLALRYGVPTVLLEGREPTRFDDPAAGRRTVEALVESLRVIIEKLPSVTTLSGDSGLRPGDAVPIRSRYAEQGAPCELEFFDRDHRSLRRERLEGTYSPCVRVTRRIRLPEAYLIPKSKPALLDLLLRHGVDVSATRNEGGLRWRQFHIRECEPSPHARRPPRRLKSELCPHVGRGEDYAAIRVTPHNARLLAALLEPQAKYGLSRYRELGIYPRAGDAYPILRREPARERTLPFPTRGLRHSG